ncbi:MAG: glycosyltransferase [Anaerolineae bacterium]|jgi:glycosyltransferase involved in cell wall biosynthesis
MDRYHQEDLPAILRSIDVVIVPSLWHETFSIVAREALLSGTPVVASEVGALPEIVEHGRNGLLVPAGGVDALHGALQRLSVERGLLARLQDGARHSAKQIKSREEHVLEVEQIYESLQPAPEIP